MNCFCSTNHQWWGPHCQAGGEWSSYKIPPYHILFRSTLGTSSHRLDSPGADVGIHRSMARKIFIRESTSVEERGRKKAGQAENSKCHAHLTKLQPTYGDLGNIHNLSELYHSGLKWLKPFTPASLNHITWTIPGRHSRFLYNEGKFQRNWQLEVVYWQHL